MTRCEDYPCCGHSNGECPNSDDTFNCCQCGKKLKKDTTSSLCNRCIQRVRDDVYSEDGY